MRRASAPSAAAVSSKNSPVPDRRCGIKKGINLAIDTLFLRKPDLPGPLLLLQTMWCKSTSVTRVAPAGMWSAVALWALEPPASASLRRGKPAAALIQYLCKPCAVNPPVLPSKHSTFSEYKQFLCISLQPFFIFKTYVPLFLICGNAKRKSERVAPAGMWSAVASLSSLQ